MFIEDMAKYYECLIVLIGLPDPDNGLEMGKSQQSFWRIQETPTLNDHNNRLCYFLQKSGESLLVHQSDADGQPEFAARCENTILYMLKDFTLSETTVTMRADEQRDIANFQSQITAVGFTAHHDPLGPYPDEIVAMIRERLNPNGVVSRRKYEYRD